MPIVNYNARVRVRVKGIYAGGHIGLGKKTESNLYMHSCFHQCNLPRHLCTLINSEHTLERQIFAECKIRISVVFTDFTLATKFKLTKFCHVRAYVHEIYFVTCFQSPIREKFVLQKCGIVRCILACSWLFPHNNLYGGFNTRR